MEILLYGIIGDPDDRLDAATVTSLIRGASGDLAVRINSVGGLVFEGLAIHDALTRYDRGRVTVHVDGIAASIASVIALAGNPIVMAENAMMMIHDPSSDCAGTARELRADADKLDKVGAQLAGMYARRTGKPVARIAALMAAETWFTADEAKAIGLADRIGTPSTAIAMADVTGRGFLNVPARLKGDRMPPETATPTPSPAPAPSPSPAAPAIVNQVQPATINQVREIVAQARLPEGFALDLLAQGLPVDQVRTAVIDRIAAAAPVITNYAPHGTQAQTFDNPSFSAQTMADALYARMSGRRPEGAAVAMMNLTMTDMAREMLEHRGVRGVRRMRPDEVFNVASQFSPRADYTAGGGAMTTGDFPGLLQNAGARYLMDTFEAAASAIKLLARTRTAADFRAITALKLSGAGKLDQVPEGGSIERGTFKEGAESYSVTTFAKIFALSRQALINDDLGAFTDPLRSMGRASAETEAQLLAGLLTANNNRGVTLSDGKALFHADHGNLAPAAAAAVPSVASLDAGRQVMRAQKDTDDVTPLNATAKYILSGAALETPIEQLMTQFLATLPGDTNPFIGKLTPLVDPRITGIPWSLWADPASMPVLEYAYLNGGGGPIVETRQGWDVLGTEFRVILDFGAGVVDHRGAYLNPGKAPA
ncbi:Clp protease ClpP [Sphingomonas endophytica]|uniref:ATP-dependent Clp protease proteolytic subunit n=1 Tax=Sphingomonas endophytica TaxID=869719 RepID=A0ABR6N727_9SPHN|nr:head maturation protease, ClpP-related [Sphingomonas endophytica]MBB5726615.1 ATP-dependent protease ClpP protease subunit [Sphingomonas endophytica]